jgi:hypothetical protein
MPQGVHAGVLWDQDWIALLIDLSTYQNVEQEENAQETQTARTENAQETHGKRTKDTSNTIIPIFERERGRENDLDLDGFQEWFASWPTSLTDNEAAARFQWSELSAEQRAAVKAETINFINGVKASGRKAFPTADKFLAQRMWERLRQKLHSRPKRHDRRSDLEALRARAIDAEDRADCQPPKTVEEIKAERRAIRVAYLKEAIENNKRQG